MVSLRFPLRSDYLDGYHKLPQSAFTIAEYRLEISGLNNYDCRNLPLKNSEKFSKKTVDKLLDSLILYQILYQNLKYTQDAGDL